MVEHNNILQWIHLRNHWGKLTIARLNQSAKESTEDTSQEISCNVNSPKSYFKAKVNGC